MSFYIHLVLEGGAKLHQGKVPNTLWRTPFDRRLYPGTVGKPVGGKITDPWCFVPGLHMMSSILFVVRSVMYIRYLGKITNGVCLLVVGPLLNISN